MVMTGRIHGKLMQSQRLLHALVIFACLSCAFGQPSAPETRRIAPAEDKAIKLPEFEVSSVKLNKSAAAPTKLAFTPDGVTIENATLLNIIRAAYGMFNSVDEQFIGIPYWATTERYDIEAKVAGADAAEFNRLKFDQRQIMVQALLEDRFALRASHETRERPVYILAVAKNGSKLKVSQPAESSDPGGTLKVEHGQITGQNVVLSQFVTALTRNLGRTVINKTEGLQGKYDFTLNWGADELGAPLPSSQGGTAQPADASGPSIFTAIQDQLGLKLEPGKGPVECVVIDHLERPSAN
jgi:uncharacterized protein (TIGR03435 family)